MGLFDFLTETIGVDPGSQNIRIANKGKVIYDQPSVISVNKEGIVTGVGKDIKKLTDQVLIKPVNYAITDFQGFEEMLKGAIKKGMNHDSFWKPALKIFMAIPSDVSEVEKRAYRDSSEHCGAKEVYMIHQFSAIAIGMSILFEKKDFVLIDFSASKIDITVFVDCIPVIFRTLRLGTSKIISLIKNYALRAYDIKLTDSEIEQLLFDLSNNETLFEFQIHGKSIPVQSINELLQHYFVLANDVVQEAIEEAKTNLSYAKIMANGIYFSGGGSANSYLRNKINLTKEYICHISKTAFLDCTNGIIEVMAHPEKYTYYLIY